MPTLQIPTELLYDILERTWSSTLTPAERVQLMTTSRLVSKTWFALYDDIFSKDIHIPSKSVYFQLFNDSTRNFSRCKRITFTVFSNFRYQRPLYELISASRFDMKKLTSLRAINIGFYNADFFIPGFFPAFPDHLPELTIFYTFSPYMPLHMGEPLCDCGRFSRSWIVRYGATKFEVHGTSDEYIGAVWESLFPGRARVCRDVKEAQKALMALNMTKPKPLQVHEGEVRGIRFLSTSLLAEHHLATFSSPTVSLGDIGYIQAPTGAFRTLFNVFNPNPFNLNVIFPLGINVPDISIRGSIATSSDSSLQDREPTVSKVKRVIGSIFKAAGGRASGAIEKQKNKKNAEYRYFDRNQAELWLRQNVWTIVAFFGIFGAGRDKLIFVTGSYN